MGANSATRPYGVPFCQNTSLNGNKMGKVIRFSKINYCFPRAMSVPFGKIVPTLAPKPRSPATTNMIGASGGRILDTVAV
jgi:hypothetical protein